ncbi:uncharacterized protein LOC143363051 [Halictus rubicundus]|uniref:uncharacterized protein LOC143363051 n=1 Tax=Halictus rubicundus TaxID=77578 RepID=UPI00403755F8
MFGTKLRTWMEAHIVRSKKKKDRKKGDKGFDSNCNSPRNRSANRSPCLHQVHPAESPEKTVDGIRLHGGGSYATASASSGTSAGTGSVNLSSPESAYSTGYSTDGTSPGASFPPEYYINIRTGTHYFQSNGSNVRPKKSAGTVVGELPVGGTLGSSTGSGSGSGSGLGLGSGPVSVPGPGPGTGSGGALLAGHGILEAAACLASMTRKDNRSRDGRGTNAPNKISERLGSEESREEQSQRARAHQDSRYHRRTESFSGDSSKSNLAVPSSIPPPLVVSPSAQSPRERSRIRTNPWLSANSSGSSNAGFKSRLNLDDASNGSALKLTESSGSASDVNVNCAREARAKRELKQESLSAGRSPINQNWRIASGLEIRSKVALSMQRRSNSSSSSSTRSSTSSSSSSNSNSNSGCSRSGGSSDCNGNEHVENEIENPTGKGHRQGHGHGSRNCNRSSASSVTRSARSSEDDITLNEMMGKFDESYVYEKETDILSDSDPTDCEDCIDSLSDVEAARIGAEDNDPLGNTEFDYIDNGSFLDLDNLDCTGRFPNTGHCTYFAFTGELARRTGKLRESLTKRRSKEDASTVLQRIASAKNVSAKRPSASGRHGKKSEEKQQQSEKRKKRTSQRRKSTTADRCDDETANLNRALLERMLLKNSGFNQQGSRSVGGTPICLRRKKHDVNKNLSPIRLNGAERSSVHPIGIGVGAGVGVGVAVGIGGGIDLETVKRRSNSVSYVNGNIVGRRIGSSGSAYMTAFASEIALIEADKEADKKCRELILEAENILVTMQKSQNGGLPLPVVPSPSRKFHNGLANKRVELIKNTELNIELALSKSRNSQPELQSGSIRDLEHTSPKRQFAQPPCSPIRRFVERNGPATNELRGSFRQETPLKYFAGDSPIAARRTPPLHSPGKPLFRSVRRESDPETVPNPNPNPDRRQDRRPESESEAETERHSLTEGKALGAPSLDCNGVRRISSDSTTIHPEVRSQNRPRPVLPSARRNDADGADTHATRLPGKEEFILSSSSDSEERCDVRRRPTLMTFRSVDMGPTKEGSFYCPQSEPVKRKVYAGSTTYGRIQKTLGEHVALRNSDGDTATDDTDDSRRSLKEKVAQLRRERLVTVDAQDSHMLQQQMSQLRKQMLMHTIEGLKRSLEDQSATLKQTCLEPVLSDQLPIENRRAGTVLGLLDFSIDPLRKQSINDILFFCLRLHTREQRTKGESVVVGSAGGTIISHQYTKDNLNLSKQIVIRTRYLFVLDVRGRSNGKHEGKEDKKKIGQEGKREMVRRYAFRPKSSGDSLNRRTLENPVDEKQKNTSAFLPCRETNASHLVDHSYGQVITRERCTISSCFRSEASGLSETSLLFDSREPMLDFVNPYGFVNLLTIFAPFAFRQIHVREFCTVVDGFNGPSYSRRKITGFETSTVEHRYTLKAVLIARDKRFHKIFQNRHRVLARAEFAFAHYISFLKRIQDINNKTAHNRSARAHIDTIDQPENTNMKPIIDLFLFYVCASIAFCNAQDILGCGGFLKSHANIDFAKVQVKLYTKAGSLKDATECAPNNGYYFLPLYDKGEYVLKVDPPRGWSFDPMEVLLNVDGTTDACSQGKDINFIFKGFGITGRVTAVGSDVGPKGVTIALYKEGSEQVPTETTLTAEGGTFYFTPIQPGKYVLVASHPTWVMGKDTVKVTVQEGNMELEDGSLVVSGYDVSGRVTSEEEPVGGVTFLLIGNGVAKNCATTAISKELRSKKPICHVVSDKTGKFLFPSVSPGEYKLVPYYAGGQTKFDVQPAELSFKVNHNSVVLRPGFKVTGFTVSGSVRIATDGDPLPGAKIFLSQKEVAVTDATGKYVLDNMKAGQYSLKAEADNVLFTEKLVKISPSSSELAVLTPSAYKVCGKVTLSAKGTLHHRKVSAQNTANTFTKEIEMNPKTGEFCFYLSPDQYLLYVVVTQEEREKGLQFFPLQQTIDVSSRPVNDVNFLQLKATLSGTVKCLSGTDCSQAFVTLKVLDGITIKTIQAKVVFHLTDGQYRFTDVLPGHYEVLIDNDVFCWENPSYRISVISERAEVPGFVQTGFSVTFISSHDTTVLYSELGDTAKLTLALNKGSTKHCVSKPGVYTFAPTGCHVYERSSYTWDTSSLSPILLQSSEHSHKGSVKSVSSLDGIKVSIETLGEVVTLGPLKPVKEDQFYKYEFEFNAKTDNVYTITPLSDILLFSPPSLKVLAVNDCQNDVASFIGEMGMIIAGKIEPPLEGVTVQIFGNDKTSPIHTLITRSDGAYTVGPLDKKIDYSVTAEKDGYVITGPDSSGVFLAHKLAEIIVQVSDQADNVSLQGVLLSFSGGQSYRKNSVTGEDGRMVFNSLSPGEYYLRPMMKEYRFDPPSKMIKVMEGATLKVELYGKRVAFSAYGSVTSLNGKPEAGLLMEVQGQDDCGNLQEETTTEENGNFRIRGLQPRCTYVFRLKPNAEANAHIQRTSPESIPVQISQDIHGLRLITFHPISRTDVSVHVVSVQPEHYRTLKVKLCREDMPDSPIHTSKLETQQLTKIGNSYNVGFLVHLPPLQTDGRKYFVQLESSLSETMHKYRTLPFYFEANSSFKHVKLTFNAERKIDQNELSQTSVIVLPFIMLIAFAFLNREKIWTWLSSSIERRSKPSVSSRAPIQAVPIDPRADDIIVEQIMNINKKKTKPRKT